MRRLNYFISYAHKDRMQVDRLLDLLQPRFKIMNEYNLISWRDGLISLGEQWKREIYQALEKADFGLLMLSPEFFASDFIVNEELSHFIGPSSGGKVEINKPIVPVGLKPVPLNGDADLKGVQEIQIFRDNQERWFTQTRGNISDNFADELTKALRIKLQGVKQ